MDNLTALNLIIGFLSPILISTINQPTWDSRAKVAVTVLVSVVAGFLTCWFSNQFNTGDITSAVLVTLVSSITAYHGIFKPTGVSPKIELKTSPMNKVYKEDQSG